MNVVILAGGQGTRLWPMSRKDKPKQFFPILSDAPMIVDVYERLRKRFDKNQIYIATVPELVESIKAFLPEVHQEHFFIEPSKHDSGPAMAYAAFRLGELGKGDESFVFVPTDHYIADEERFLDALLVGKELIEETGKMVDISVAPQFPSTALGYTHIGEKFETRLGVEVYHFLGHKEKPDQKTAQQYIESGSYLWHANYYMWTPKALLSAYEKHAPDIYRILMEIKSHPEQLETLFATMPTISIDYAVTEKMNPQDVLIIRGDFGWSDIGAWDILYNRLSYSLDEGDTNVTKGKTVSLGTNNCLIYSQPKKIIATIGLDDLVIVDTEDALLICPKNRSQEVKDLIKKIRESGDEEYL